MATPAHRLIQDQNLNFLYNGSTPAGKTDVAKADKKGGLARRKALNDISNSRKPSVLPSGKKDNSTKVIAIEKDTFAVKAKSSKATEKAKVGGRKALSDLTNSVKPPSKPVPNTGRKMNAVTEENVPSSLAEERFLHNHQECIKAQTKAIDMDYFLKSVGLNNDIPMQQLSPKRALQLSSNKPENKMKHLEIKEMPEHLFEDQVFPECKKLDHPGYSSPGCRSPKSPKPPYMNWDDEDISDLMVVETPKLH
ncbi:hypothetical protein CDL12_07027 [Handroanthus impetiginosus]|uniref:Uncharacterized protein n=1 Tax=Handroanthus impetiginosus TaxID=429701 RepID=A0A2G9HS69_9LAMI|nr:hypothetical protein CDL12_07027 [Handroanthus impetiginosus]